VPDGLRGEHSTRGTLPARRHCREPVLHLVEGVPGGRKMAPCGRHRAGSDQSEVRDLRREARELKEVVAEQALKLRLLKKSMIADGG
jgi:transposase